MDPISNKTALAAAGAGGEALYVDDVFSTFLYEGTGSARTITNGIDLSGEGGMVWIKGRDGTASPDNLLFDTERGATNFLTSNGTDAENSQSQTLTAFTNSGFTLGTYVYVNSDGSSPWPTNYASWSFRKAPGFFDVVTYTGDGTNPRSIAHSLGSKPGFFIIKRLDAAGSWWCYHHSRTNSKVLELNTTAAEDTFSYWPSEPTSTHFTVNNSPSLNGSGNTYVCYLFAHDDQSFGTDEDEAIIHCGSFNGGGVLNSNTIEVNTGFEPQFVLIKRTDSTSDWYLYDTMRSLTNDGNNDKALFPNKTDTEAAPFRFWVYQNGFAFDEDLGGSSAEWIYMAIRRPNKPPEAGTDVFTAALNGTPGSSGATQWRPENVDMAWFAKRGGDSKNFHVADRIRGFQNTDANSDDSYTTPTLRTNSTGAELTSGTAIHQSSFSNGVIDVRAISSGSNFLFYRFKRAPGFFDVVAWAGDGTSNRAISHNLTVTPELLITKRRTSTDSWWSQYTGIFGTNTALALNLSGGLSTGVSAFTGTSAATSSVFYVGSDSAINGSGDNYIAYLFATLPGISKVGSYTGTGSDINVDCGFTAGARFVLIKRTDSTGDWYVYDSTRGIVGGNDPYLLINSTAAEVTNTDYIDPLNSGFTVTSSAPAALNASGGTYIFLAIA